VDQQHQITSVSATMNLNKPNEAVNEGVHSNQIKVQENTKIETRAVTVSKRKYDCITNGSDQPTHEILQKPKRI